MFQFLLTFDRKAHMSIEAETFDNKMVEFHERLKKILVLHEYLILSVSNAFNRGQYVLFGQKILSAYVSFQNIRVTEIVDRDGDAGYYQRELCESRLLEHLDRYEAFTALWSEWLEFTKQYDLETKMVHAM